MGQGFLFIVFPCSEDMGKETTTSQVEYMAYRKVLFDIGIVYL